MTVDLTGVAAEVFEVGAEEISDGTAPATLGAWTSLKHVQLVIALEEAYGVSFSRGEIKSMSSVGRIRDLLRKKGAEA